MIVHYSTHAEEDLAYWTLHSKKITQRIESLIEGSGILDMIKLCRVAGVSAPEFRQDGGQFVQTLWRPKAVVAVQSDQHSRPTRSAVQSIVNQGKAHDEAHDEAHEPISWVERQIMEACHASSRSTLELLSFLGYAVRTGNFKRGLNRLIAVDLQEMSMPDKPRSGNQKYRLSAKGHIWLAKAKS